MKVRTLSMFAAGCTCIIAGSQASAQLTRISVISKPNEFGILVCNVYAEFDLPPVTFIAVGGAPFVSTFTVIDGTFFQSPFGNDRPPNPKLFSIFPSLRYDTFVTLGVKSFNASDPGVPEGQPQDVMQLSPGWPGFGPSSLELTATAYALPASSPQGDPFNPDFVRGDGGYLIGQFSTENGTGFTGDLELNFIDHNGQSQHQIVSFVHTGFKACLSMVTEQTICHADGSGFTFMVDGVESCSGSPFSFSFTAAEGDVGQQLCFSVVVNDDQGQECCVVELCTTIPNCALQATVIHVDANCPGPGDGSVGDPYCSIQTAIDNAVDTVEIIVAPGTYFEAIDFLGKAITLRSSDGADVTTIDGTGFFHVVQCVSGEGPDTLLDGFTITGGNADGDTAPERRGGGMYNELSSPTVSNCTFSGNSSSHGGGMYNNSGSPMLTNCTFSGNSAGFGGGMHNNSGSPTLTYCTFSDNLSNGYGGGMYTGGGSPTLTYCTFSGNFCSEEEGGGMFIGGGSPTVSNCTFSGNFASRFGGGMSGGNATVSNCTFTGNTSSTGGAMIIYGGSQTVTNCTFSGNMAYGSGGGMVIFGGSQTVTGCTFSGNTASRGGGMYNLGSPTMTNCTFSGNFATSTGGGMWNSSTGDPTVTNCTFIGNMASEIGGGMFNLDLSSPTVANCILWGDSPEEISGGTPTVTYSDVEGGWSGDGFANIDTDPLFVDPDNGDYRLQSGSPCIDAGDNTAVPEGVLRDLDGNPRFIDSTFVGTMATVDMGAYEYQRSVGGGRAIGDGSWLRDVLTLLGWNALPDFD